MSHRRAVELERRIEDALGWDRPRLRQRLRSLFRAPFRAQFRDSGRPAGELLDKLVQEIERSCAVRRRREELRPRVRFDESLPVAIRREDIANAIFDHQVVVVCGETGSGKSTQLPKICLDLNRGIDGLIGHTQPRRIAARSIATRIAEELQSPLGTHVGFKVRFHETVRPEAYIKLMTDGILLAETQSDRFLNRYDTLIIDEAHERSLNIDFLLGYLKNLLPQRPDLKLIITSATIDAERFSQHFRVGNRAAPIVEVSGRTYPVEIRYRPPVGGEELETDWPRRIVDAMEEFRGQPRGDVLVFLPTEYLILETAKVLRGTPFPGDDCPAEIVPLYARLSTKDQQRVFEPHQGRRVILATNVAESSLTVPGIRYVVDTGTARISRYSSRSKLQRLPIEPISRASADQRAGRSGRVAAGVCVRLYSADDYAARDRYSIPEICRTNLAAVILQTKAMQLGAIEHFPFLDPPQSDMIRDGYDTLFEIGALNEHRELTELGRRIAALPVDPRVARILLAGMDHHCLPEILIIASALEVQDPRERPADKQERADDAHAKFLDAHSDFLGYLKLWDYYRDLRASCGQRQLRRKCQEVFLSYERLREWNDVHRQLCELVEESLRAPRRGHRNPDRGQRPDRDGAGTNRDIKRAAVEPARYAAIHRAILSGLLSGIALRSDEFEYTGANGNKLYLWPGSGVFRERPKWIIAAELVETSRRYARTVAKIEPAWIEPLSKHLVEPSYRDPFWSRAEGAALLLERVTLFGLPIVKRRRVRCAPIDPITARELLIRHGLVEGDIDLRAPFLRQNQQLVADLARIVAKSRRRGAVISAQACFDFYHSRLPATVTDASSLHHWRRRSESEDPRVLMMTPADVVDDDLLSATPDLNAFPDEWFSDDFRLPLEYRFEPGSEDDGVSIVVPIAALNKLTNEQLDWLVPGMLLEKIEALLRMLPKSQRREVPPAPEAARQCMPLLEYRSGPFLSSLAVAVSRIGRGEVRPEELDPSRIPYHLQMKVRVVDDEGRTLAKGTDVVELRRMLGVAAEIRHEIHEPGWQREDIRAWDFDALPEILEVRRGGIRLPAYPALIDRTDHVSLTLLDEQALAEWATRRGIRRLICLQEAASMVPLIEWLPHWPEWIKQLEPLGSPVDLRNQVIERVIDRAYLGDQPLPRSSGEFARCLNNGRESCDSALIEVTRVLTPVMRTYSQICHDLQQPILATQRYVLDDIGEQLDHLMFAEFLVDVPWRWWAQYPRYLRAIQLRWERLRDGSVERDRQCQQRFQRQWQRFLNAEADQVRRDIFDPELDRLRWMLEEFRVSLFAQTLGTSLTISEKKLDDQYARLRR